MDDLKKRIKARSGRMIAELCEICRQPSISAKNEGVEECAALIAEKLKLRGFDAEVWELEGSKPAVYGYLPGTSGKTLLFYGHYDVVPAEPLDKWTYPPFEPTVDGDLLYGRGVGDHKSSFVERLHAVDVLLEEGPLPVGVKFFLEGEEELGSPNLGRMIDAHREQLKADASLYVGGFKTDMGKTQIRLGKKGNLAVELSVASMSKDTLSYRAALLPNAAWRLVKALATLTDENDRSAIDGFFDTVKEPTAYERKLVESIPFSADKLREAYAVEKLNGGLDGGEASLAEVFAPVSVLCKLQAGFPGSGFKAVLPSTAAAHIEFQLVPDQTPDEVLALLRAHLDRRGFTDVQLRVINSLNVGRTPADARIAQVVINTAREVYGEDPVVVPLAGGAGPWELLYNIGMPIISEPGVAHAGSNYHAPNENIRISDYLLGVEHIARLIQSF